MARWEQYEVWQQSEEDGTPSRGKPARAATPKWQLVGSFMDLEVATAVARRRTSGVRLIRAIFEDSKRVEQEVLLDIGSTRRAG